MQITKGNSENTENQTVNQKLWTNHEAMRTNAGIKGTYKDLGTSSPQEEHTAVNMYQIIM